MTSRKILVADDNQQIRMLVGAALRSLGHQLLEAVDGEDALDTAVREHPDPGTAGRHHPKLDGFEVLAFSCGSAPRRPT